MPETQFTFERVLNYAGADTNGTKQARYRIPQKVREFAALIRMRDSRGESEKPTLRDIYLQLAQQGYAAFQEATHALVFGKKAPEARKEFLHIPPDFHLQIKDVKAKVKEGKFEKDTDKSISLEDVFVELMLLGLSSVK